MGQAPSHETELFAEIGLKLRAVREAKGLTLQEVSARTRINKIFLEKIEEGQLEGLPAPAFVRGFVRNYMTVLELDDPELTADLQRIGEPAPGSPVAVDPAQHYTALIEEPPLPVAKIVMVAVVVVLVLWAAYLIYRVASAPVESAKPATTESALPGAVKPPGTTGQPAQPGAPAAGPQAGAPNAAAKSAADARQGLRLTIRGLQPTWVRLTVDKQPPLEVMVQPAETLEYDAEEEFRLTIGKSHGIALYLNGEDILLPEEPNRLIPSLVLNKLTLLKLEN